MRFFLFQRILEIWITVFLFDQVTDFGLSKFIDSETMLKTFCGTPNYLAPEILKSHGTGSYTEAIDLWSLGVILFVSLSGYPPFSSDYKDQELNKQILAGNYHYFDKEWQGINEDGILFYFSFKKNFFLRIFKTKKNLLTFFFSDWSCEKLFDSFFSAIEVVKNLLVVDPKKRMTVGEALNSKWLQDPWVKKTTDQLIEEAMRPPQQMTQLRVSFYFLLFIFSIFPPRPFESDGILMQRRNLNKIKVRSGKNLNTI